MLDIGNSPVKASLLDLWDPGLIKEVSSLILILNHGVMLVGLCVAMSMHSKMAEYFALKLGTLSNKKSRKKASLFCLVHFSGFWPINTRPIDIFR